MSIIERSGEKLARFIDRRKFLKQTAISLFSFATASAISLDQLLIAHATYCTLPISGHCNCQPLGNQYCNNINSSYCSGSKCSGGCSAYIPTRGGWPNSGGCWCTLECPDGNHDTYYVCCDCKCPNNIFCTCAQANVVILNR